MEKIRLTFAAAFPPTLSYQQCYAAEMLLDRPDMLLPNDQELDRLLECESLPDCLYGQGFGFDEVYNWFEDVLKSIGWWVTVTNLALENPTYGDGRGDGFNPDLSDRRKDLSVSLCRVMEAFPAANDEIAVHGMDGDFPLTATVSLMRRYRIYTRQVEALVAEAWPNVNEGLLKHPDFSQGDGHVRVEYVN